MAAKSTKSTKSPRHPFAVRCEHGGTGRTRFYFRVLPNGTREIPLGRFLGLLGSHGWGNQQVVQLLTDLGIPPIAKMNAVERAEMELQPERPSLETLNRDVCFGRLYATGKGRPGYVIKPEDESEFGPLARRILPSIVDRIGGKGVRVIPSPSKAKAKAKAKAK